MPPSYEDVAITRQYESAFGTRCPYSGDRTFIIDCALCGAAVLQEQRRLHAKWHAILEGTLP